MHSLPNRPIYLDNQATTPCDPRVLAAMLPWFTEHFGNPHSAEHVMGRQAEDAVEAAREEVGALIGAESREIVFTSGATESNNIAIKGAARFARSAGTLSRRRVITIATEHKCALEAVRSLAEDGFEPVELPVSRSGLLDLDLIGAALREPTLLVSVMTGNNEIGVIQDIAAIATAARAAGALFHTDAAQAVGKIPIDVQALGVDLLSISGHKLYGPKGVGALYVRRRPRVRLTPLFSGGGQERGLRSGTLPAPLVIGFGVACRLAGAEMAGDAACIGGLRDLMLARLRAAIPDLVLNGDPDVRLAGNLNLTFPHVLAAELMAAVPDVCLSTGSACSSAEIEPSYVLRALGLTPAEAARTLRIGIGRFTSRADIEAAADAIAVAYASLAASRPIPARSAVGA
ncbi:MAG TPA: aminotransferase class V-fold PLP-dependent enzyme [Acetobacteraceae bacterium]|jgi:cysteine desulfurase|nr:aminotransferase class V-fold PLP-dependent enzyme [Acetobacteraceae bacterium]